MITKRYASALLTGILMALGMAAAVPAPASATGITCTHRIEWYRSTYEVTAAEVWNCSQAAYQITAVEITTPRRNGNTNTCLAEWSCRAVATVYNSPGTQRYCATGGGSYWYGSGPFQKHTPKFVTSCIYA